MEQQVLVGVNIEDSHQLINDRLEDLDIDIKEADTLTLIDVKTDKDTLCDVLADYVMDIYTKRHINRFLLLNYSYLSTNQMKDVFIRTLKLEELCFEENKTKIFNFFKKYLERENEIVIDGFVAFRLSFYIKRLEENIEKAMNEIFAEKEYHEFIQLLKYFVDLQDSKTDVLHVIINNSEYLLFDSDKKEITNEYIEDFKQEVKMGSMNEEDLLISTLITIAPLKIFIHNSKSINNTNIFKTIESVFENSVIYCENCEFCFGIINSI